MKALGKKVLRYISGLTHQWQANEQKGTWCATQGKWLEVVEQECNQSRDSAEVAGTQNTHVRTHNKHT